MQPAVADLYHIFKPYQLGDDFIGCDHCVSVARSERLAAIPLRKLTIPDVDRYAFKAMTTWGTGSHFKHFLPRLLELAFDDYLTFGFPEVLLGKLAYANWPSWPALERKAVLPFLDTFWLKQLHSSGHFPADERIETVLGGLVEACDSVNPPIHNLWPHSRDLRLLPPLEPRGWWTRWPNRGWSTGAA